MRSVDSRSSTGTDGIGVGFQIWAGAGFGVWIVSLSRLQDIELSVC